MVYFGILDGNEQHLYDDQIWESDKLNTLVREHFESVYQVKPEYLKKSPNCSTTAWNPDQTSPQATQICNSRRDDGDDDVILTLFTSFVNFSADPVVYENTLRLYSQLKPEVQPLLFVSSAALESALVEKACSLGWHVAIAPRCNG